jgi:hypothetical protein
MHPMVTMKMQTKFHATLLKQSVVTTLRCVLLILLLERCMLSDGAPPLRRLVVVPFLSLPVIPPIFGDE